MVLYLCTDGKALGGLPAPIAHTCGRAAKALDDAGHRYEIKQIKGGTLKLWTRRHRTRDRTEIQKLSGQRSVPILVLDNAQVITGAGTIVRWAHANPPRR